LGGKDFFFKSLKHFSFVHAFETSFVVVVTHNNFPPYLRTVALNSVDRLSKTKCRTWSWLTKQLQLW